MASVGVIASGLFYDNNLPSDAAIVEDGDLYLNHNTWMLLSALGCLEPVWDYLAEQGEGQHIIPSQLVRPCLTNDSDVARQLSIAQPGEGCTIPGCLQGDVAVQDTPHGSFPLCAVHRADFDTWQQMVDSLPVPG